MCVWYLFRPRGIDGCFDSPPTMIEFFEHIQVVTRPPGCVGKYMRQHGLQDVAEIPAGVAEKHYTGVFLGSVGAITRS